jgi:hypothetical protein
MHRAYYGHSAPTRRDSTNYVGAIPMGVDDRRGEPRNNAAERAVLFVIVLASDFDGGDRNIGSAKTRYEWVVRRFVWLQYRRDVHAGGALLSGKHAHHALETTLTRGCENMQNVCLMHALDSRVEQ